jgi:VCBS repeat-containing protein
MQKLSGLFLFAVLISGAFSSSFAFAQVGPIAEDDFYSVDEDSLLTVNPTGVLLNDTNTQSDTFFALIKTNVGFGVLTLNQDGSFTYQPNQDFASTDSFTYVANNGTHNSTEATVSIFVNPINDAPVAQDDQAETQQNVPIRIDVLENDSDTEDDSLNIILTVDPSQTKGTVELEDTKILFTPNLDFVGETSFSYVVSDGDKTSNSAQVTVTITTVDDPNDDSVIDQILEQIQSLFDKVLNLEDEVTQLKEDNSALALRVSELESIVANGIQTNDDDNDDNEKILVCHKGKKTISISENGLSGHLKHGDSVGECSDNNEYSSKKEIENQIKALKKDFKTQEKALKNDFKAQEKDLKKQLKELKKDKKHHDEDDDDTMMMKTMIDLN